MKLKTMKNRVEKLIKKKNAKAESCCESGQCADANMFSELVEKKAYELYEKNGRIDGNDWSDWLEAEKSLKQK